MQTKKNFYYIALVVGVGIFIHSLTAIDFNDLQFTELLSSGIWLLFIVVVLVSLRDLNKDDPDKEDTAK